MSKYGIETSTMLCEFNASVWTGRKLDRSVTDEVTESKSASKSAGRFNKNLFAGRSELTDIQAVVGAARTYVYANTAPWSDSGQRWIPTARLLKLDQRLADYKAEFDDKVDAFVALYPTLITAQAMSLGTMFNRNDFPQAAEIRHRFAFNYDFLPVPSVRDFRIDIANDAQEELRSRLEGALESRVSRAVGDVQERLVEHLTRMATRLGADKDAKTGEDKPRKFHDTLVTSAFDLCDLVKDFNCQGDKTLAEARQRLEAALTGVSATTLREDPQVRETTRKEVAEILDLFKF